MAPTVALDAAQQEAAAQQQPSVFELGGRPPTPSQPGRSTEASNCGSSSQKRHEVDKAEDHREALARVTAKIAENQFSIQARRTRDLVLADLVAKVEARRTDVQNMLLQHAGQLDSLSRSKEQWIARAREELLTASLTSATSTDLGRIQ